MPNLGEKMNSAQLLQLVKETTAGTYAASGERLIMTCLNGGFLQPEDAWDMFRAQGFNDDVWHAITKSHRVWQGTVQWDYEQSDTLLQMLCGAATTTDTSVAGKVTKTFELPVAGQRDIIPFTVEYGLPDDCERCPYGLIQSISQNATRDGAKVDGQITIICQQPVASGVAMTGTIAANQAYALSSADGATPGVITVKNAGGTTLGTYTDTPGSSNATVKAAIEAIPGITTANVTGSVPAASGTVANPTAAPTTGGTGGSWAGPAGTYLIAYSYINATGETLVSPTLAQTYTQPGSVPAVSAPILPAGATNVKWYMSQAGGSTLTLHTTGTGGALTFIPTNPPAGGAAASPTANTTGTGGGTRNVIIASPANTRFIFTTPSAGWSATETARGKTAGLLIPAAVPMVVQNAQHYRGNDFAALNAQARPDDALDKCKGVAWSLGGLVDPVWYASDNQLSYSSHVDGADRQTQITLTLGAASSIIADVKTDALAQPATPNAFAHLLHHPDGLHALELRHYSSVRGAIPQSAGGNVKQFEVPLGPVLPATGNAIKFLLTVPA